MNAPGHLSRHRVILLYALLSAGALLPGCAQNPVTGHRELVLVSETQEVKIGTESYVPGQQQGGGPYVLDPGLATYVRAVGQKLAAVSDRPHLPYEFVVLNESVPNAWAMPGGKIAINRGLLVELENEAELAAVLGHEIVHAAARHGAQRIERGYALQVGLLGVGLAAADNRYADLLVGTAAVGAHLIHRKYGRDDEREADLYGMKYMANAGYDTAAAASLQEKFVRLSENREPGWLEGLFASHPPSPERVRANRDQLKRFPPGGYAGTDTYQRMIAGLERTRPAYAKFEEGLRALGKEQPERALALASQALDIEPREALFYGLRGDAYLALEANAEAKAAYDEAIARNAEYYQFYLHRGIAERRLGNLHGAQQDLDRSNRLMPTAVAHLNLGELALAANQPAEATRHFRIAASSRSAIGQEAAERLQRLDLPANPDRYISVGASPQVDGRVLLSVRNHARVAVRNLRIEVTMIDRGHRVIDRDTLTLRGVLAAGAERRVRSAMRLPDLDPQGVELRSRVRQVEVEG